MSASTVTLVALAAVVYSLKAAAPLVLGGRELPVVVRRVAELIPAALLSALVVVSAFADGSTLAVDARAVGLLAAVGALLLRAPFVVVVLTATTATALTRLVV